MIPTLGRILILLPLVWFLTLAPSFASAKTGRKLSPSSKELAQVDFSRPIATLGTPERSVSVFRLVRPETSEWSYMIVRVDGDGTRLAYGDELTVGAVLGNLSADLVPATRLHGRRLAGATYQGSGLRAERAGLRDDSRCTKAAGWRFETPGVRVSTCTDGLESSRIERAIDLLEIAPDAVSP